MQERRRSWSVVGAWTSCRVQGELPCAICRTGVGSNSISCNGCKYWVHKKCSGLKRLTKDPDYRVHGARELHVPWMADHKGSPSWTWQAGGSCFLLLPRRHALSSWWLWTFNHNMCENHLEPVLSSGHFSFKTHGHVYSSCVWSAMLHASETWPLTKPSLQRLQWKDRATIKQMCNVKPQDTVTTRSNDLLAWLGIEDLYLILKEKRLHWYGHMECSNGAVKTAFDLQVDGKRGPGRPRWHGSSWQRDCREWKLSAINPHDRHTWKSGVRSAICAASQLPGRGPTDVDIAPVPAC